MFSYNSRNPFLLLTETSRFLLAILFFQSLHDKATPKAVKKALDQLGRQTAVASEDQKLQVLGRAYDEAMERIDRQLPDLRSLAKRVLAWITCARRPLVLREFRHALAVEFEEDSEDLDEENMLEPGIMISVCAGLVTVDDETNIRLVHYTTQEYFERTQDRWFPDAHLDMARTCVRYLSYRAFAKWEMIADLLGISADYIPPGRWHSMQWVSEKIGFFSRVRAASFYDYAATHWGHHARKADTDCDEVMAFLQCNTLVENVDTYRRRLYPDGLDSTRFEGQMQGIHLAAMYGLERALRRLLFPPCGVTPDARGYGGYTPLMLAARFGREGVVTLLLATGAVDAAAACNHRKLTALHCAAEGGHEAVVRELLGREEVDVNAGDDIGATPIMFAANEGHEGVVRLLLATGRVDLEVEACGDGALQLALEEGHMAIAQLLREHGAKDPPQREGEGGKEEER